MYFFIAVLNCMLVCFVLPRPGGREEGLAQRTSCLPAVFHYFMFLSIFPPQFCVLLQFPPFQLQPPLSLFLLPSRLLFSFCFSSVLTCSSFPCRFLAFVISPAFFQQILQGSSQLLTHLWSDQFFAPLAKKNILFSMLKLSLKKDKLRMSDLLSFLVLYVLLAISTFTVGSLCYQCHPFSNTLYSSSFLCLQSPALLALKRFAPFYTLSRTATL